MHCYPLGAACVRLSSGASAMRPDEHGSVCDATWNAPAACWIAGHARIDQAPCAARRGARAQRRLGQRAHHSAARAVSALSLVLRSYPDPDLGRLGDRAGAARHQRHRPADASSAAARQGTIDPAQPVGRPADSRRRGRLAGAGIRGTRRAVQRARPAHGRGRRDDARSLVAGPGQFRREIHSRRGQGHDNAAAAGQPHPDVARQPLGGGRTAARSASATAGTAAR